MLFESASVFDTVYGLMQLKHDRVQLCPTCAALEREASQVVKRWLALERSVGEVCRKQDAFTAAHQAIDRLIEQRSSCKECHKITAW